MYPSPSIVVVAQSDLHHTTIILSHRSHCNQTHYHTVSYGIIRLCCVCRGTKEETRCVSTANSMPWRHHHPLLHPPSLSSMTLQTRKTTSLLACQLHNCRLLPRKHTLPTYNTQTNKPMPKVITQSNLFNRTKRTSQSRNQCKLERM